MPTTSTVLAWSGRATGTATALFFAAFALAEASNPLVALFMLIPAGLLLLALIIAWRMPAYGGASFLFLGALFVWFYDGLSSWGQFLVVCLPSLLAGALFIAAHLSSEKEKTKKKK